MVAVGLRREPQGTERTAALAAHGLTPPAIVLVNGILGYGLLFSVILITAEWWALAAVTGLRPRRLTDPGSADSILGLGRLAAWLALTAVLACFGRRLLLP